MTTTAKPTQGDMLLQLLRERGPAGVTPLQALELIGTLRLGARVYDLKADGHDIRTQLVETPSGKHVARYTLHEGPAQLGLRL